MKVENMTSSSSGAAVANQFILTGMQKDNKGDNWSITVFQSYNSIVAKIRVQPSTGIREVLLDEATWDFSRTTGKYRNKFLRESKKETQKKIDSGEYILTDLNK